MFALIVVYGGTCYAWGRVHAPTRTVVQTQVMRVEKTAVQSASAVKSDQRASHSTGQERIVTKWRTAPSPGCAPMEVVRVEQRAVEREVSAALLTRSDSKREHTSSTTSSETLKVTVRERARYAVGVDGGLRFEDATALVRGRFEIRALGPLWITVWSDRYAAGAGARLEF
jgi:hypothetical protein